MQANLWMFLTVGTIFGVSLAMYAVYLSHKRESKKLEIEALKVRQANVTTEVEDAVARNMGDLKSRIEVLEAIVTDNKYQLNEKISRLK